MTRRILIAAVSLIASAVLARGLDTPQVVDEVLAAEKPEPSTVLLLFIDRPWSEFPRFRSALDEKLRAYIAYVENGELTRAFPRSKGKPVRVVAVIDFPPSNEGIAFLDGYKPAFRKRGITLQWHIPENVRKAL